MNFYKQEDYEKILKKKKINLIFIISLAVLFASLLVVFIILSTYKTRILFSIIASSVEFIVVGFEIYFIAKYFYLKRIANEYNFLLSSNGEVIVCEVVACSDFLTTLPDKSRCYEVLTKKYDLESIYYLSEIFSKDDIKPGTCKLTVCSDYIVGVKYEN